MISQLRAALEEERQALLAQTEQLRLSLDDECEYRASEMAPPRRLKMLSALCEDGAPSASLDHLKARGSSTRPGAPPEPLAMGSATQLCSR